MKTKFSVQLKSYQAVGTQFSDLYAVDERQKIFFLLEPPNIRTLSVIIFNPSIMYSLNKAQLIGNLTADPEVKETPNGRKVANFSVATNRRWTDQNGATQDATEFHNIVIWWKLAEIAESYAKKGNKVYIEGRLQTSSWEDQSGQKRYKTEIVADQMILLTPKWAWSDSGTYNNNDSQVQQGNSVPPVVSSIPKDEETVTIEDVPF